MIRRLHGFSLVELLVALSVIALLVALLVVVLPGVLRSGSEVKSLANLRTIGQTFATYSYENDGEHIFYVVGEEVPPAHGGQEAFTFSPVWNLDRRWPFFVRQVAPWRQNYEAWASPGADPERFWTGGWPVVSYHYSNSYIADPRLWNLKHDASPTDIRATRAANVTHPSAKVIAYDAERAYLRQETTSSVYPALFSDGSSSLRSSDDASQPVPNRLNHNSQRRFHDTTDGIDGRDY